MFDNPRLTIIQLILKVDQKVDDVSSQGVLLNVVPMTPSSSTPHTSLINCILHRWDAAGSCPVAHRLVCMTFVSIFFFPRGYSRYDSALACLREGRNLAVRQLTIH